MAKNSVNKKKKHKAGKAKVQHKTKKEDGVFKKHKDGHLDRQRDALRLAAGSLDWRQKQNQANAIRAMKLLDFDVCDIFGSIASDDLVQQVQSARYVALWTKLRKLMSEKLAVLQAGYVYGEDDHEGMKCVEKARAFEKKFEEGEDLVRSVAAEKDFASAVALRAGILRAKQAGIEAGGHPLISYCFRGQRWRPLIRESTTSSKRSWIGRLGAANPLAMTNVLCGFLDAATRSPMLSPSENCKRPQS